MPTTKTERLGAHIAQLTPPGTVKTTYLAIRVTAPNGQNIFIDRSHREGNKWRIRRTNNLAIPQQTGTHHTQPEVIALAVRYATEGITP